MINLLFIGLFFIQNAPNESFMLEGSEGIDLELSIDERVLRNGDVLICHPLGFFHWDHRGNLKLKLPAADGMPVFSANVLDQKKAYFLNVSLVRNVIRSLAQPVEKPLYQRRDGDSRTVIYRRLFQVEEALFARIYNRDFWNEPEPNTLIEVTLKEEGDAFFVSEGQPFAKAEPRKGVLQQVFRKEWLVQGGNLKNLYFVRQLGGDIRQFSFDQVNNGWRENDKRLRLGLVGFVEGRDWKKPLADRAEVDQWRRSLSTISFFGTYKNDLVIGYSVPKRPKMVYRLQKLNWNGRNKGGYMETPALPIGAAEGRVYLVSQKEQGLILEKRDL